MLKGKLNNQHLYTPFLSCIFETLQMHKLTLENINL